MDDIKSKLAGNLYLLKLVEQAMQASVTELMGAHSALITAGLQGVPIHFIECTNGLHEWSKKQFETELNRAIELTGALREDFELMFQFVDKQLERVSQL